MYIVHCTVTVHCIVYTYSSISTFQCSDYLHTYILFLHQNSDADNNNNPTHLTSDSYLVNRCYNNCGDRIVKCYCCWLYYTPYTP